MNLHEQLLSVAKEINALQFGHFILSSGGTSKYYFDGRLLSLNPQGALLIAQCLIPILKECGANAIAGPTLGADPIVASVAAISQTMGTPIPGLIVRKEKKMHGGGKVIEGHIVKNMRVAVIDDTCTSGASLFHTIEQIEKEKCVVVKVLSIMDRMAGGSLEIKKRGYDFYSLFTADDNGQIICTSL
jgi:orotate phosphoribosyltransferase